MQVKTANKDHLTIQPAHSHVLLWLGCQHRAGLSNAVGGLSAGATLGGQGSPQHPNPGAEGTTDLQLLLGHHNQAVQISLPLLFHLTERLHILELCRVSEIWVELLGIFILQTIQKSVAFLTQS